MLFSALSLKVLVGLGAVVGASVLSIHYTSKNTNTDALNSKQGEAVVMPLKPEVVVMPEDEPAMPEPEADITLEQAAKKLANLNYRIRTLDEDIGTRTSTIVMLDARMPQLEQNWKETCKNHREDKINHEKSLAINVNILKTKNLEAKAYESEKICDTAKTKFDDAKTKKSKLEGQVKNKQDIRKSLRPF